MSLQFSLGKFNEQQRIYLNLKNKIWVIINWVYEDKTSLIFKGFNDLIITKKGKAEFVKWEFVRNNIIIIKKDNESYVFDIAAETESIVIIKSPEENSYIFLVEESLFIKGVTDTDKVAEYFTNNVYKSNNYQNSSFSIKEIIEIIRNDSNLKKQKKEEKYRKADMIFAIVLLLLFSILAALAIINLN